MNYSKSEIILVLADTLRQKALTKKEMAVIIGTNNNQNVQNYCKTLTRCFGSNFYIIPSENTGEDKYILKPSSKAKFNN